MDISGLKKSAPRSQCNLLALGVPLRLFPRHGIPAARRLVGYLSGLGTAFQQRRGRVDYSSSRLNSGWGSSLWGTRSVQREWLVLYSYFFCEGEFVREVCGHGFLQMAVRA